MNELKLRPNDRKFGTYLVFLYLFFYYVRPQEFIPGLGAIRISGVVFLVLAIWGIIHFRTSYLKTPLAILLLMAVCFLLSGLDAINVSSYKLSIKYFTEVFPQCLAIYIIFNTKESITNLIKLWCVIYFFMALITIRNGGLGPGDFTWDPNDAALALAMGIPWCIYAIRFLNLSKKQNIFCWMTFFLLILAIVITQSRGGFVGLVAVFFLLWWFSKRRVKLAIYSIIAGVILSGMTLSLLPEDYINDLQSINDPEDETRLERIHTWEIAWLVYKNNPILGVGAGNFPYNAGEYQRMTSWWTPDSKSLHGRVTHSLYFQVLSELGTLGAFVYLYIIFILPIKIYRKKNCLQRESNDNELINMMSLTLIVSMAAYAISGTFISVAYYPHIPIWIALYAILKRHVELNEFSSNKT